MQKNRITEKTIALLIALTCIIFPFSSLWAEDYPAGFLGPGYREYLNGRILDGYRVETFAKLDNRLQTRVDKRNQIEEILNYSYQAAPAVTQDISLNKVQGEEKTREVVSEITTLRQQREKGAAANGGFYYVKFSDGKNELYKDGLLMHIDNERVVDEFGNLSYKNTYDMQYNEKRLLISYEANLKDNLGNFTHLSWSGAKYTDDSVFYGNKNTNVNKNLLSYILKETDHAGNVKTTTWNASTYEGKLLRAFSQTIEDTIYGISSFTRNNITYRNNDPDLTSTYHEEGVGADGLTYTADRESTQYNGKNQQTAYYETIITTQVDGRQVKTTVDAKFKYLEVAHQFGPDVEIPDPNRLLESIIHTTVDNPDGSSRSETTTTTYNYDLNQRLIGASGKSLFNGQEEDWFEYKDSEGRILSRSVDENGRVTYSYLDPETSKSVIVAEDQVTATLKSGNLYDGSAEIQYEILGGRPLTSKAHSLISYYDPENNELFRTEDSTVTYKNGFVNNLLRTLGSQEYTETAYPALDPDNSHKETLNVTTEYFYDAKGNLVDAAGEGVKKGYEYSNDRGWAFPYTSTISIDYEVVLGKALRTAYREDKNYQGGVK